MVPVRGKPRFMTSMGTVRVPCWRSLLLSVLNSFGLLCSTINWLAIVAGMRQLMNVGDCIGGWFCRGLVTLYRQGRETRRRGLSWRSHWTRLRHSDVVAVAASGAMLMLLLKRLHQVAGLQRCWNAEAEPTEPVYALIG